MFKIYLTNKYFNNNDISLHLVESTTHFIIEQNICSYKEEFKIKKTTTNAKQRSINLFNEKSSIIHQIINSTKMISR